MAHFVTMGEVWSCEKAQAHAAICIQKEGSLDEGESSDVLGGLECATYFLLEIAILTRPRTPIPIAPEVE